MIGYRHCRTQAPKYQHPRVMPDPITGDWCCAVCFEKFRIVPDKVIEPPRAMDLWERIKWAFRTRTKVPIVPFVWSIQWAQVRDTKGRPPDQPHWHAKKPYQRPTDAQLAKVYDHWSMRPYAPKMTAADLGLPEEIPAAHPLP